MPLRCDPPAMQSASSQVAYQRTCPSGDRDRHESFRSDELGTHLLQNAPIASDAPVHFASIHQTPEIGDISTCESRGFCAKLAVRIAFFWKCLVEALCWPCELATETTQVKREHRVSRSGTFPPLSRGSTWIDQPSCTSQDLERVFISPRIDRANRISSLDQIRMRLDQRSGSTNARQTPRPFGTATSQLASVRNHLLNAPRTRPPIDWTLATAGFDRSVKIHLADLATGLSAQTADPSPPSSATSQEVSDVEWQSFTAEETAVPAHPVDATLQDPLNSSRQEEFVCATALQLENALGDGATRHFLQQCDGQLFGAFARAQAKYNCQLRLSDEEFALIEYMQNRINEILGDQQIPNDCSLLYQSPFQ